MCIKNSHSSSSSSSNTSINTGVKGVRDERRRANHNEGIYEKNYFPPSLKPIVLMAQINLCRITFNNDLKQSDILSKKILFLI